jgi:HEPN domain-containing protein
MNVQDKIKEEFTGVIAEGEAITKACGWTGTDYQHRYPDELEYLRLRTQAMNLIRRVCGGESDHYLELRRLSEAKESTNRGFFLAHVLGIAKAAQHDFEQGLLFDVRSLVAAELLGDFTDQAEALVKEGFYVPAASLAGAVLEDALRKLCQKHGVPLPSSTKIDRLNADLAKAGVYSTLVQKQITVLADIRNKADHGKFKEFTREDVENMVKWLRRFSADYFG